MAIQILDTRFPQPGRYSDYGVPTAVAEAADKLLAARNLARDMMVDVIDGALIRLLSPWTRGAMVEELGPVASIDVGFDVRTQRMPIQLRLIPGAIYSIAADTKRVGDKPTRAENIVGDASMICRALIARGYSVIAATTPNGREIRATADGFEVQPHNDNTWIATRTLDEAMVAFKAG